MKKRRVTYIILLCYIVLFIPIPINAEEYIFYGSETYGEWENAWEEMKDSLPEEVYDGVKDYYITNTPKISDSKLLDTDYWWNIIRENLSDYLYPGISNFSVILGMLLIMSLCQQLPLSGSLQNGMNFCTELCMAILVYKIGYTALNTAEQYIQSLCTVMTSLVPVMGAVSYASGEITGAAVQNTAMTLFLTVITNLNNILIRPMLNVLLALTITGSVCPDVSLGSFTGSVKRIMMTVFSFILLLYSFVYGIQTSLAKAADSLGLRTVRFALSNFIPIVGGPVSDAFSALRSGMGYIRTAAGIGGIIILVLLVLPIGISLWTTNVVFSFGNMTAEILGCSKTAKLLTDMHGILQIVSALVWMVTIFFLFSIILFTKTVGQTI